jgi:hypothetical protein
VGRHNVYIYIYIYIYFGENASLALMVGLIYK